MPVNGSIWEPLHTISRGVLSILLPHRRFIKDFEILEKSTEMLLVLFCLGLLDWLRIGARYTAWWWGHLEALQLRWQRGLCRLLLGLNCLSQTPKVKELTMITHSLDSIAAQLDLD